MSDLICPTCSGYGEYSDYGQFSPETSMKCPECNGTGRKSEPTKDTTICNDHKAYPCPNCTLVESEPVREEATLHDIADMPNHNSKAASRGEHSVSEGQIFWTDKNKATCKTHGATLAVNPDRSIWRCEACGAGAYVTWSTEVMVDPTPDLDQILGDFMVANTGVRVFMSFEAVDNAKQSLERWATERVVAELESLYKVVGDETSSKWAYRTMDKLSERIAKLKGNPNVE